MKTLIQVPANIKIARFLSHAAVEALLEEVRLSPKPGLVDSCDNGCHDDLSLDLMEKSAISLESSFYEMALAASQIEPSQRLRERLAAIGRYGEQTMLEATGNVNTHKGAIWAIGLLCASASTLLCTSNGGTLLNEDILELAGSIAKFEDRFLPLQKTKGGKVRSRYKVRSAREEAIEGFPSLRDLALPARKHFQGQPESIIQLNVLLTLMANVDDTCILHRSNMQVLQSIKFMAAEILQNGGLNDAENWIKYLKLDAFIINNWVSPGGSADLLAASIFLNKITQHF
ncbi:triphosphoribosyl-dephospho-CoA synthase [Pedobacter agri]|uniref:triphosphoribosyl-dephospho-CoA synthase n=1 Tax=Pedobacter agri TaxID=454586 RepID=UPI002930B6CF|nr:triphosphoribosyl-dephospho-CoA synthase [Pedobacter agri]